jgi:signal transduction histidine kinase
MNIYNYVNKFTLGFKNINVEREYDTLRNEIIIRKCKWFALIYLIVTLIDFTFSFVSRDKAKSLGKEDLFIKASILPFISIVLSIILIVMAFCIQNIKIQKTIAYLVFIAISTPIYHIRFISWEIYSVKTNLDFISLIKFFEIITRALMICCEVVAFLDCIFLSIFTITINVIIYINLDNSDQILPNAVILLFLILFSYNSTRSTKEKLIYVRDLNEKKRYKNIFENMKSYFLYFSNRKIKFLNQIFVEALMKNKKIKTIPRVNKGIVKNDHIKINPQTEGTCSSKVFENNKIVKDESDSLFLKENSEEVLKIIFENLKMNESMGETDSCYSFLSIEKESKENFSLDCFLVNAKKNYLKKDLKEKFMFLGFKEMVLSSDENSIMSKFEKKKYEVYFRTIIREEEEFEVIFNDISEIKQIEEKSAELKYKSLFLSKVAHEFKNPLICISELVNELKSLNESTDKINFKNKSPKLLKQIQSMSDYLLILIKDLDYFSNMQVKKDSPKLEMEKVDLTRVFDFCSQIAETLIFKNNKRKIDFVIQNDIPNNFIVLTDEVKLKQILINLISNSIKFTNQGFVKLIAKVKQEINENQGKIVLFEVWDSGIGLEAEQVNSLGDPFIKGKKLKNSYGSGLGLYIVTHILKQLNSEIKCNSIIGQGTCFSFSLPIENSREISIQLLDSSKDSSNQSSILTVKLKEEEIKILDKKEIDQARGLLVQSINFNSFSTCQILNSNKYNSSTIEKSVNLLLECKPLSNPTSYFIVVDDEKFTRMATLRVLKQTACKLNINIIFVEADDGLDCLSFVNNFLKEGKKISGIISDEMMHHMNGSTLAEILKKIKNFNTMLIPFYVLTALNDFSNNYVDYIISKPMTEKEAIKIFKK